MRHCVSKVFQYKIDKKTILKHHCKQLFIDRLRKWVVRNRMIEVHCKNCSVDFANI